MHRIAVLGFAFLIAVLPALAPAFGQEAYPTRPITLVVPYAAGGGSDFLGRVLAEGLRARLNETVVVQNVGGAGSVVGSMQVAKARPDGYTLLINHIGLSTVPALYKKINFDPLASYEFIGLFAEAPMMILARTAFAPKTFAELVAYAKDHKDKFTMASSGMGSSTHLCAMLFQEVVGVPITIVQYKGSGPAVIDVRSGQVDAICDLTTTNSALVRSGDMRAYLLTAPQRLATLPDVPTARELGISTLDIGVWFGVYAPLGTPKPIVDTLSKALQGVVQDKEVADKLATIETYLLPVDQATPEALHAKLESQIKLWTPIIEKAGVQAE
jgi:tripartite-type tricarboxylate transporter receptor subunit TctC